MQKNLYIFIHGIGSNKDAWNQYVKVLESDSDIKFQHEKFSEINEKTDSFFSYFEYGSPIINDFSENNRFFSWVKKKKKGELSAGEISIPEHATALYDFIKERKDQFSNLYILAHSMGGLITLECLFSIISSNEFTFLSKIKKVALFASPLTGSDDADDIKNFFQKPFSDKLFSFAVQELATDSNTIVALRKKIGKYKVHLKKMDILFLFGLSDSRITKDSKILAESFCKAVKNIQLNHSEIKEPKNLESESYSYVKSFFFPKLNEIALDDLSKHDKSILLLEQHWNDTKAKSFVILESYYTNTLYANSIYISHLKYKIKMMEDGEMKFSHRYRPFDTHVNQDITQDPFFINEGRYRFENKSHKVKVTPESIPCDYKLEWYQDKDGIEWVKLIFSSNVIPKNTEFFLEISISDLVDLSSSEDAIKRRQEYFSYSIDEKKNPHGVRFNKYQIETYNDSNGTNVALPFQPWLSIDGKPITNHGNCQENVYYKTWEWSMFFCEANSKKVQIQLREANSLKQKGPPCH